MDKCYPIETCSVKRFKSQEERSIALIKKMLRDQDFMDDAYYLHFSINSDEIIDFYHANDRDSADYTVYCEFSQETASSLMEEYEEFSIMFEHSSIYDEEFTEIAEKLYRKILDIIADEEI